MAYKKPSKGEPPLGLGGDTFESGAIKLFDNTAELFTKLGANVDGDGVLPSAIPTGSGGTGATTAAGARNNLGLGSVATKNIVPIDEGGTGATNAAAARTNLGLSGGYNYTNHEGAKNVGAMGLYNVTPDGEDNTNFVSFVAKLAGTGIATTGSASIDDWASRGFGGNWASFISVRHRGGAADGVSYGFILLDVAMSRDTVPDFRIVKQCSGIWGEAYKVYSQANTTVDGNGFLKAASPIVQLFADKIELNHEAEQQYCMLEKRGIGDYLIINSTGFAQEGWYIEMPKDANGNVLCAVEYGTTAHGEIEVRTYKKKFDTETASIIADKSNPVDIPEGRWIDIRLQELAQSEDVPPTYEGTI